MGYALARAAAEHGAHVTLITTINRETIFGVRQIMVKSAQEMYDMSMSEFEDADYFIAAAAVADFKPTAELVHKIKKQADSTLTLNLVQNPDILKAIGQSKKAGQRVVGFAAETQHIIQSGQEKLVSKNADMLVANDVSRQDAGFSSDNNAVTILTRDERAQTLAKASKIAIAREIIERMITLN